MTPAEIADAMQLAVREHQAGRLAKAEDIYRRVLAQQPDHADALHLLGVLSHQIGQLDLAVELIRKAITIRPTIARYHNNLGNALRDRKGIDDAITAYRNAIRLDPNDAVMHYNLGVLLHDKGLADDAIAEYRQALALNGNLAEAHNNLAKALRDNGLIDEPIAACWAALRIKPDYAEAHNNLGNSLSDKGALGGAIAAYRNSIRYNPGLIEAHNNLGSALREKGQLDEAIASFREAIRLSPDFADAHQNLAAALLLTGQYAEGWQENEWRWRWKDFTSPRRQFRQSQWDGSNLAGQTILLHAEQGMGDTIQFARYVPMVWDRGGRIIVECPVPLAPLLRTLPGVEQTISTGQPLPEFDVHCPMASLPLVFETSLESIPGGTYLKPDSSLVEKWAEILPRSDRQLRVGLAWAGNPKFKTDHARSIRLAQLAPLAEAHGASFYSLQKGAGAEQAKEPPRGMRLIDFTGDIRDFADTAALLAHLDLVISVDTSVAHLAGAMGKPVWTLLPFLPDWRWLLAREDSPWYPTMRLFRQESPGNWSDVIRQVADSLAKLSSTR